MNRTRFALALLVAVLIGAAASPASAYIWGRWRVVGYQGLVDISGSWVANWSVSTIQDAADPTTCLIVLRDASSGAFSTVLGPASACR